jgi:hypothetical protein
MNLSFKSWMEALAVPQPPDPKKMATSAAMKTAAARTLAANGTKKQAVQAMKRAGANLLANPNTDPKHVLDNVPDEDDNQQRKMMKKK